VPFSWSGVNPVLKRLNTQPPVFIRWKNLEADENVVFNDTLFDVG